MAPGVISGRLASMPRWPPDARARLQEAAFALYDELGFDEATVAEITERAGLTKRTFFRYFADKREVPFWGAEHRDERFVTTVQAAPAAAGALDAVSLGLDAVAARSDEQR